MAAGKSIRFKGIKQIAALNQPSSELHKNNRTLVRHTNAKLTGTLTLVKHAYLACKHAQFDQINIVLGANTEIIQAYLPEEVEYLIANDWHLGLGHSIASAVRQLPSHTTHVCIGLADQAAIKHEHYTSMIELAKEHSDCVIAARYSTACKTANLNSMSHQFEATDRLGAPCIFPAAYFNELSKLTGDKGAKALLRQLQLNSPDALKALDLPQASVDIDTRSDLTRFIQNQGFGDTK
jgi:molybdenum cofactor cytidylyltransferase